MIDIGVNLTHSRFDNDVYDIILRSQQNNIEHLLVTGTNITESQKAIALCNSHSDYLSCTAGIHPHDADNVSDDYLDTLELLTKQPVVKAIGECGLDFNRNFSTPSNQKRVFQEQVELAHKLQLPLFLHQRDAFTDWFAILKEYIGQIPFMITHCFTGSADELEQCLEANMYIGITGWLCDERRGQSLRNIISQIPLNRLMIETDAPYLTPRTIKPKPKSSRNEPSYLPYIVKEIAKLTDYSAQDIIEQTTRNARYVFSLRGTE